MAIEAIATLGVGIMALFAYLSIKLTDDVLNADLKPIRFLFLLSALISGVFNVGVLQQITEDNIEGTSGVATAVTGLNNISSAYWFIPVVALSLLLFYCIIMFLRGFAKETEGVAETLRRMR